MDVLVRLNNFGYEAENISVTKGNQIPVEIRKDIFSSIRTEYEDSANDKESWLYEEFDSERFLFGLLEPERLIDWVLAWNGEIRNALYNAMTAVLDEADACARRDGTEIAESLVLDTPKTYALSCAAREADNHWYDYADHAVLLPNSCGYTYFQTIIPDEYLKDIRENPQDYAIVTVFPK